MSVGLKNSRIEQFRKRSHGSDRLRLLSMNDDGDTLKEVIVLTKGFFIGRNADTTEGATPYVLTIDTIYTPALTVEQIEISDYCELFSESAAQRYHFDTNTPPIISEWRYICALHPAFSDKKPITP